MLTDLLLHLDLVLECIYIFAESLDFNALFLHLFLLHRLAHFDFFGLFRHAAHDRLIVGISIVSEELTLSFLNVQIFHLNNLLEFFSIVVHVVGEVIAEVFICFFVIVVLIRILIFDVGLLVASILLLFLLVIAVGLLFGFFIKGICTIALIIDSSSFIVRDRLLDNHAFTFAPARTLLRGYLISVSRGLVDSAVFLDFLARLAKRTK